MAKGNDLEERILDFAVRVIRACESLPKNPSATHIRGQLLRSGTSPAANYAEARSAESNRDFVHKLKVVLKELNETKVWLRMLVRAELVAAEKLDSLIDESDQLSRIISQSIKTAQKNNLVNEDGIEYEFDEEE